MRLPAWSRTRTARMSRLRRPSVKVAGKVKDTRFLVHNEHGVFTLSKDRLRKIEFIGNPAPETAPAVPVPNLSGSFALKRGIATAKDVRLELDGQPARLEGSVDLLLWAADLTFRLDAAGGAGDRAAGLKLVGPLDRPQIRLLQPPAPILPEQAP